MSLENEICEPCSLNAVKLTEDEISELHSELNEWDVLYDLNDVPRLSKKYKFKNFKKAIEFTNKVGDHAEAIGHHPLIITEWGKVTVQWWSHELKGLHRSDFVMAAKTDKIYEE